VPDLFDIALGRTNDVHYSFRELPFHAATLARYWWHSETTRHRAIARAWASLIGQATASHAVLIERAGADNLIQRNGYRVLYRNQRDFETAIVDAERLRKTYGVAYFIRSMQEMAADEPSLKQPGVGGIHWRGPWTASDPGALVASYADVFARLGGRFAMGDAETLAATGHGWTVKTGDGPVEAEQVVFALGPWSGDVLKRFGHRFPMVRKRGYHAHYRSPQPLRAPVMDTEFGYVLAPMTQGMRITTGAHLARFDVPAAYDQLERAETAARQLVDLGPRVEDKPWHGTRPCMPDMLPVIGQSRHHKGLWMNFGHGHQGFTLGPATAAVLARMMAGEAPGIDMVPFRPERY
jgi:D-amino-acid dehydrogenase